MSLDMDIDLQDRPGGTLFELAADLQDRPAGSAFELETRLQDRSSDGAASLDGDFDRQECVEGGEVSLDRLADVINAVLAGPASEGLALLIQTQLARSPAPEVSASSEAAPVEGAEA